MIKYKIPSAKKILCHGTRNAAEQLLFLKHYPNSYVIGTEISPTASNFPHTIQHDFHKSSTSLINFDIVYTNSLDHSYNPHLALDTWKKQLSPIGTLIIQHTPHHSDINHTNSVDCFHASLSEYLSLTRIHFNTLSYSHIPPDLTLIFASDVKW